MGTDVVIVIVIDHPRSGGDHGDLIERLNARFSVREGEGPGRIQLRRHLGYRGDVVLDDGAWVWQEELDDESGGNELLGATSDGESLWHRSEHPTHAGINLSLSGPWGLDLHVLKTALYISTGVPWEHLVYHEVLRSDLRALASTIAGVVGGSRAIFLPDDIQPYCDILEGLLEGRTFEDVENALRAFEEPNEDFRKMVRTVEAAGQLCWEARGFLIDTIETTG